MGRRKRPFYRIVAIDSRKRRDGAEIERLGWYDPLKADITIELKIDRIVHWLSKGAQPSETVDNILKENGLKYRLHLMKEGKTEDEVEVLFAEWQINQEKKRARALEQKEAKKIAAIKAKEAEIAAEAAEVAEAAEEAPAEEAVAEAAEEAPAEEAAAEATEEAPAEEAAAEATEEAPAEEVTEDDEKTEKKD